MQVNYKYIYLMSKDMYDSKLLKIYRKNPISCYENILAEEEEEINDICRCVLLVLYSIDEVIKKLTGLTYNYYIENSESVFYVFHLLQLRELNEEQFEKSIFILDFSKLIYHFTCAKKFLMFAGEVIGKLEAMSDAEFAEMALEAVEYEFIVRVACHLAGCNR